MSESIHQKFNEIFKIISGQMAAYYGMLIAISIALDDILRNTLELIGWF